MYLNVKCTSGYTFINKLMYVKSAFKKYKLAIVDDGEEGAPRLESCQKGCSACVEACCGSGHWASAVMEGSVVLHQSA